MLFFDINNLLGCLLCSVQAYYRCIVTSQIGGINCVIIVYIMIIFSNNNNNDYTTVKKL